MRQQGTVGRFEVVFEPEEEGGYHVYCPLLKGCHSYGATKDEARESIAEAIEAWLESAKELGLNVPDHEVVEVPIR
jgi:predicted RNase H-like HicB family nuclease